MKTRVMPCSRVSNLSPGRIALGYAVIAILWIAFSDVVVTALKLHPSVMTLKGIVFVFVTAGLLYYTIRRLVRIVQLTSLEREETAELYRTVVEASNEGICLLDESGRISFLNGRLAALLGHPAGELQGKRLQDFIEEPYVLGQPSARESQTRECRLRKGSDPNPWVLLSRHPVLNETGDLARLLVTVTEITEPQPAGQTVRRNNAYAGAVPGAQEKLTESQFAGPARYGLAILLVSVALGTALLLRYFQFRDAAIPLLLFAVAISSWSVGTGPAVFAVILSTIGFYYYFVEPVRTIYIYWSNVPYFLIFVAFAALISWFATIRRRVEAGLRAQADLLNLTHDSVFVMSMEGVIRYWNRGAEELYGWPAEKTVGKVVHALLQTVFPRPLEEIKAELVRTGRWEAELVHTKKDGTEVAVASRWSLQRDRHGAPFAILETNNDISERKRAEQALSRLNRELRAISNCNQILLRATDEQSLLEQICQIVCEEAGYRMAWVAYAEHDEAKSIRPVASAGAEDGHLANLGLTWADTERGRSPTGTAIRTGKHCCIQDFGTDPRLAPWREDALQRGFRSGVAFPLKDEQGRVFGALTIFSAEANAFIPNEMALLEELAGDLAYGITALRTRAGRRRAETALQETRTELERVSRVTTMGALTASIAHEVNQPLAGVVTSANAGLNWLAANPPNLSKAKEALERVRRDGTRAGEVITRIRGLLKRTPPAKSILSVNPLIHDVLALLAGELRAHNIETAVTLESDIPSILGDTIQLQQVLLNLITNAIDAMAGVTDGQRTLRLRSCVGDLEGRRGVVVAVCDTGMGLGSMEVERLFDAFHTTKPQGMGMGLWISRSIVEEHGGRLTAQNNSGPGATFVIIIPAENQVTL